MKNQPVLFESTSFVIRVLGPTWDVEGGTLVETTSERAMALAVLLRVPAVIMESGGQVWRTITDRRVWDYGVSYPSGCSLATSGRPLLMESSPNADSLLQAVDRVRVLPSPGAVLVEDHVGLSSALHLIAEASSPEEAEDKEDTQEDADEGEGESDPALWEGAEANFELDEQDWQALANVRDGDASSLDRIQTAFLEEVGLIEDGLLTDFGTAWLSVVDGK